MSPPRENGPESAQERGRVLAHGLPWRRALRDGVEAWAPGPGPPPVIGPHTLSDRIPRCGGALPPYVGWARVACAIGVAQVLDPLANDYGLLPLGPRSMAETMDTLAPWDP